VFYYYHPDHLGSAQLMTDRAGEVVQHYGYSPFGKENYQNNTYAFEVSSRYTGQTLDEDTGLYYYGARYYDPELARFIQPDSTVPDPEFSQAYNRYAYVYNNPLKFTDPTGQFPWALAAAVMKAVSAFNTLKAICVAVHTGDFRGLAVGLACSILGGAIGGQIGGAIANGSQLAMALGGAIGAATFTAAFTGGNVARAIGEAVVWAYASHYCKLKANATTASVGERSIGQEHSAAIANTNGSMTGPLSPEELHRMGFFFHSADGMAQYITDVYLRAADPSEPASTANSLPYSSGAGLSMDEIHFALDVAGMVEVPGTPVGIGFLFDTVNAAVYLAEGRPGMATASVACIVGADVAVQGSKYGLKALKRVPGVYEFGVKAGKYVGQSNDLSRRIGTYLGGRGTRHIDDIDTLRITPMPGSTRLERRIMEQTRINQLGGIKGGHLDNVINSIRESDWPKHGIQPPR